jgi:hypothetical protein
MVLSHWVSVRAFVFVVETRLSYISPYARARSQNTILRFSTKLSTALLPHTFHVRLLQSH